MRTTVKFRGEFRLVEFTATDKGRSFDIDWCFAGLTRAEQDALDLSEAEDDAIFDACCEAYLDHGPGDSHG